MSDNILIRRLALFAELASKARLGRTAIMKLCFFLQESRGMSLGYQFSIYSYGPFDSDVLSDLSTAVQLNVLKSTVVYYPSGSGYEYGVGSDVASIKKVAADFIASNKTNIDWVMANFASKTAAELELLSTTLFVGKFNNPQSVRDLVNQVAIIKPHFSVDRISKGIDELQLIGVFRSGLPKADQLPK